MTNKTAGEDNFFWIKKYLISKTMSLKIASAYKDSFDRKYWAEQIGSSGNIDELYVIVRDASNNGLPTLYSYVNPLYRLQNYIEESGEIEQLSDFNDEHKKKLFEEAGNGKKYSIVTIKTYYGLVNSFFKYIEKNSPQKISFGLTGLTNKVVQELSEGDASNFQFISFDDLCSFLDHLEKYKPRRKRINHIRFMVKLIIFGSLNSEEVSKLRVNDLAWEKISDKYIKGEFLRVSVQKHSNPQRDVLISGELIRRDMDRYLEEYISGETSEDLLFYTSRGKPYRAATIYQQIDRIIDDSKMEFMIGTLKKSYAAKLMIDDVDYAVIARLFGSNNTELDNLYLYIAKSGLKKRGKNLARLNCLKIV